MSYIEHIARAIRPVTVKAYDASEEMKRQCAFIDGVANYLDYSGFFSEIQITYMVGLSAGSILCHYHLGTPVDDVGDLLIELHGSAVQSII